MERTSEEVRYAVIGVPFLCISFHTSFPGQVQKENTLKRRVRFFLPITEHENNEYQQS